VTKIHILAKKMVPPCFSLRSRFFFQLHPVFSTRPRVSYQDPYFPPDPVFSTRPRVFHQTPCFPPDSVFSTRPRVLHWTPCFPHPMFSTPQDPIPQAPFLACFSACLTDLVLFSVCIAAEHPTKLRSRSQKRHYH